MRNKGIWGEERIYFKPTTGPGCCSPYCPGSADRLSRIVFPSTPLTISVPGVWSLGADAETYSLKHSGEKRGDSRANLCFSCSSFLHYMVRSPFFRRSRSWGEFSCFCHGRFSHLLQCRCSSKHAAMFPLLFHPRTRTVARDINADNQWCLVQWSVLMTWEVARRQGGVFFFDGNIFRKWL